MAKGKKTGGRKKGTPNKADSRAREAIGRFVEMNTDRFQDWLEEIYSEHGAKEAFGCVVSLIEYHVPKLGRMEHTGEDGKDISVTINKVVHSARDNG